jgi:AraC-like DNA-binding protein
MEVSQTVRKNRPLSTNDSASNAGYGYLDIVQACSYSDHAHFAKDFKAFAGCSLKNI